MNLQICRVLETGRACRTLRSILLCWMAWSKLRRTTGMWTVRIKAKRRSQLLRGIGSQQLRLFWKMWEVRGNSRCRRIFEKTIQISNIWEIRRLRTMRRCHRAKCWTPLILIFQQIDLQRDSQSRTLVLSQLIMRELQSPRQPRSPRQVTTSQSQRSYWIAWRPFNNMVTELGWKEPKQSLRVTRRKCTSLSDRINKTNFTNSRL